MEIAQKARRAGVPMNPSGLERELSGATTSWLVLAPESSLLQLLRDSPKISS
jgi:hypothetical protein